MQFTEKDKQWLVLQTRVNFERKISRDILNMEYECYLPLRTTVKKWSDRVKNIRQPIFPGYVFAKIPPADKNKLLSAKGVLNILSNDDRPVSVSDREMERIRKIEAEAAYLTVESPYCCGDKVRVTSGPFSGFEGTLVQRSQGLRLVVRLFPIQYAVSFEIESQQVEKIV